MTVSQCVGQPGLYLAYLDSKLTIRQANKSFFTRFGDPSTKVLGRSFCDLVHPDVRRRLGIQVARLLKGSQHHFVTQAVILGPEGRAFTSSLAAMAVHGDQSRVAAVMVMLRAKDQDNAAEGEITTGQDLPAQEILSKVDSQILGGMAEGMSTAALAKRVHLSRQGVEYRVTGLLRRFHVANRTALVSRAYSMGILVTDVWPPRVGADFTE